MMQAILTYNAITKSVRYSSLRFNEFLEEIDPKYDGKTLDSEFHGIGFSKLDHQPYTLGLKPNGGMVLIAEFNRTSSRKLSEIMQESNMNLLEMHEIGLSYIIKMLESGIMVTEMDQKTFHNSLEVKVIGPPKMLPKVDVAILMEDYLLELYGKYSSRSNASKIRHQDLPNPHETLDKQRLIRGDVKFASSIPNQMYKKIRKELKEN